MKGIVVVGSLLMLSSCGGAAPEEKPLTLHEKIEKAADEPAGVMEIDVVFRKTKGGSPAWHIADTDWWVRLQPEAIHGVDKLDKKKSYRVVGVPLEQNFGFIDFWVQRIELAVP